MASVDTNIPWQERVVKKQQENFEKIPSTWRIPNAFWDNFQTPLAEHKVDLVQEQAIRKSGILTDRELEITENYTVSSLLSALASGQLTSAEVTLAYCKRAAVAQQLVNCLTNTMFDEARERAEHLDRLRAQGQLAGPLHGLPISIKDNFHHKGTESTIGMLSFMGEISPESSPLVQILLKLGAVIYVKTNVPQTMMTTDSHNNVFGRTLNPRNTQLGPGGSSGGEGALIALRGSPLGVGTDIGGSVRIPALCCGTYGFRPSAARIPNGGMRVCTTSGMKFVLSCAGPLSLDLDGIETFFKTLFEARPALYDSTILDIPWRQVSTKQKLRIGVVPESPNFPLHPPVKRALADATRILKAQGHTIIPLNSAECRVMEATEIAFGTFALDPGARNHLESSGDPPAEIREEYRKLWLANDLDVCIAPPAQSTAVQHDTFGLPPYTAFLNTLDFPSCILPFGHVGAEDAAGTYELKEHQVGPEYNFEVLNGAPCSIQLFTLNMRDEECLQIAKQLDQDLKGRA
ncbi:Amidase [Penicillium manginii]|uniref:Amidase n=1 Tax=Penicillium manginii TaxID=203109 RepID=UPI002546D4B4|nr:Amidase [Penicillium manginii]KAJ5754645.1 Amidase [Penicillium manginii]